MPTWLTPGSKKAPDTKKYKTLSEKWEMVDPPRTQFEDFSVIFVSLGCQRTHLRNRVCFLNFLLRFCGGVAEREREYSMVFTLSNAHHTLWEKVSFVMILDTSQGGLNQSETKTKYIYIYIYIYIEREREREMYIYTYSL